MAKWLPLDTVRRLALKALANGGTTRVTADDRAFLHHVEWNIAGRCQSPVEVVCHGRPYAERKSFRPAGVPAKARLYVVTMQTKCRKCEQCLRDRAAHWRLRAMTEYRASPRSWLVTLTFAPEWQHRALSAARREVDRQGIDFDTLPQEEQFLLHHQQTAKEVTLWLKRLRARSSAGFRYLLVLEHHKSGLPHYHVVLHERAEGAIRHAALKATWRMGFLDAKLIADARQATYACKYLTKSALARVRASEHYGGHEYDSDYGLGHSDPPEGDRVPSVFAGRHPTNKPLKQKV